MSRLLDDHLAKIMKDWADQNDPPANGKARLLLLASTSTSRTVHAPSFPSYERQSLQRPHHSLVTDLAVEVLENSWLLQFRVT